MTATPANIDSTSLRLHHFQQAIESVYGDFSSIKEPQSWIPPPYSGGHKGRYLWTDAFGVLNLITLHQESQRLEERISQSQVEGVVQPNGGERVSKKYLTLASRLVETVHDVLGRTRDGRSRLPGATDENPLGGGLRIGKLEERGPDGDGQYHHYLTMWMFALNRLCLATNDPYYNIQAVMLAKTIHPHFFMNRKSNSPRMVWKVKMDLSAPLVMSEGNLDPIDGYVIYRLLQATAAREQEMNRGYYDIENQGDRGHVLQEEISDYYRVMMRKGEQFVSTDPLDLGMSLWTAHWFSEKENWAAKLSGRCFEQIYNLFEIDRYLQRHIKYRLAFREFGTCLGVLCHSEQETEKERAVDLKVYADAIIHAWEPYMGLAIDQGLTENDLKPITRIMYATALIPGG